jgi:hypothetical protein
MSDKALRMVAGLCGALAALNIGVGLIGNGLIRWIVSTADSQGLSPPKAGLLDVWDGVWVVTVVIVPAVALFLAALCGVMLYRRRKGRG